MKLLQNVTQTVNEVCKKLKLSQQGGDRIDSGGKAAVSPGRVVPSAVIAVKNGRRKMEDRHVVIHDVNVIFADQNPAVSQSMSVRRSRDIILLEKLPRPQAVTDNQPFVLPPQEQKGKNAFRLTHYVVVKY